MKEVSNSDEIIDSRDVIWHIGELESAIAEKKEELAESDEGEGGPLDAELDELEEELKPLKELAEECEGYCSDWKHGAALIRESYFEAYARELAEDLHGKEMREASWPFSCIDWEKAADELRQDYSSVDFDGETYLYRE